MSATKRSSWASAYALPQHPETWLIAVRKLRLWYMEKDRPVRPYGILGLRYEDGMIIGFDLKARYPTSRQVRQSLLKFMQEPPMELKQGPHRPERIVFEQSALVDALLSPLDEMNILTEHLPKTDIFDEVLLELESGLRKDDPQVPGLLSTEGVTPEVVGVMFSAAADFYRAEPWIQLSNPQLVAVKIKPDDDPWYVQVMGQGGVEYGIIMYRTWEDVQQVHLAVGDPREYLPLEGWHSLSFEEEHLLPFDDLDAIEQYGWDVADEMSYPFPAIYEKESAQRPPREELLLLEILLRALTAFVPQQLQPDGKGDYFPSEAELTIAAHSGPVEVKVEYPAGDLPREQRPYKVRGWFDTHEDATDADEDRDEEPPFFDPRAIEGTMAQMFDELDEDLGDDPLAKAQMLMYQAWDERESEARVTMARHALSVSPDCADAYVLLAEEETGNVGEALAYFEKGVEAGERVLDEECLTDAIGHFWGILETRPYMRARQGLANCLWELGRTEEAWEHYEAMLVLNPNDNQGIRYILIDLLLEIDEDEEARILLDSYEEDGTATWCYSRALLNFRRSGPSQESVQALREALKRNPHVPVYLLGRKRIPNRLPAYVGWGDEDEAATYASAHLNYWRKTPEAVDWLRGQVDKHRGRSKTRMKRTKRKRSSGSFKS